MLARSKLGVGGCDSSTRPSAWVRRLVEVTGDALAAHLASTPSLGVSGAVSVKAPCRWSAAALVAGCHRRVLCAGSRWRYRTYGGRHLATGQTMRRRRGDHAECGRFCGGFCRWLTITGAAVSAVDQNTWRCAPVVVDGLSVGCGPGKGAQGRGRFGTGHGFAVATGQHGGLEPGQRVD